MTGRASADCLLNDMSRTVQDHTKEKRFLYIKGVESSVHVHVHVVLRPYLVLYALYAWALLNLYLRCKDVKFIFMDAHVRDVLVSTHNETRGGDSMW